MVNINVAQGMRMRKEEEIMDTCNDVRGSIIIYLQVEEASREGNSSFRRSSRFQ